MHPYAPFRPGSWVDFIVMKITGTWHADTMAMDVLTREVIPPEGNGFQRITNLPAGTMSALVYGAGGVTCRHLADGFTNGVLFEDMDANGIGERAAGWGVGEPGVMILPNNLTVGVPINTETKVWRNAWMTKDGRELPMDQANLVPGQLVTLAEGVFPSRCQIVSRGPWEPLGDGTYKYPDTVRSALWERPNTPESWVYNYVWAHDVGLVDFWYGQLGAGESVSGYQYYGVVQGG